MADSAESCGGRGDVVNFVHLICMSSFYIFPFLFLLFRSFYFQFYCHFLCGGFYSLNCLRDKVSLNNFQGSFVFMCS